MKLQSCLALAALAAFSTANAQTQSSVQSAARPYNLDIGGTVMVSGSDAAATTFNSTALADFMAIAETRLNETKAAKDLDAIRIDPTKLTLGYDTAIRVYFVGEGAGYRNSLGISTTGGTPNSADAELVFPDASSNLSSVGGNGTSVRNSTAPLLPGDFVDLGVFAAGTKLDFFLIANGALGGNRGEVYSTTDSVNRDGLTHAVSLAPDGSPYLLLSFEDLFGGGDEDYNDVVFAIQLGTANISHLQEFSKLSAPEPSMAIGALLGCGVFLGTSRRRRRM